MKKPSSKPKIHYPVDQALAKKERHQLRQARNKKPKREKGQLFRDYRTIGRKRYYLIADMRSKAAAERCAQAESKPSENFPARTSVKIKKLGKGRYGVFKHVKS